MPAPIECEVFQTAVLVASSRGGTQWTSSRLHGGKPHPWKRLLSTSRTAITTTIPPTKSGPEACPVIQVLIRSLHPNRKLRMTQAVRPMTMCQRALKRSAMKPFTNFDTP